MEKEKGIVTMIMSVNQALYAELTIVLMISLLDPTAATGMVS